MIRPSGMIIFAVALNKISEGENGQRHRNTHLKNIRKSFSGLRVLVDIDLSVERGQIIGLSDPNGADNPAND
jgi:hypothetical protein